VRKCINLEDQPGFQQIYAPQMQQAIDRGLEGHSGDPKNIDWGYDLPKPKEVPVIRNQPSIPKETPIVPPVNPDIPNPVVMGGNPYWDSLWNKWGTEEARILINKFPSPKIIKGGQYSGSHNSYEGPWSTLKTPFGYRGKDIQTLFHEYGHALDNIIGKATGSIERDTEDGGTRHEGRMETSLGLFGPMLSDGLKTGLVFDDSFYWQFIEKNGIVLTERGRNIPKGKDRAGIENSMQPGDHWRAMKQIVEDTKTNLAKLKITKNPDPVKLRRAEDEVKKAEALIELHHVRHQKVAEIIKTLEDIEAKMEETMPDFAEAGGAEMIGSFTDILAALTGDETMDKQLIDPIPNGDIYHYGSHGYGYYTQRKESPQGGYIRFSHDARNHSAMYGRRVEIWAELFQFWSFTGGATKNREMYKYAKKLFPEMTKYLEDALAHAKTVKLEGPYYEKYGKM
jgi:hypothetical protein